MKFYRHYKNKNYRYLGLVRHSETLEEMAYYECLYPNDLGSLWVRPKEMFFGDLEVDGRMQRRFADVEIHIESFEQPDAGILCQIENMASDLFPDWDPDAFQKRLTALKNPLFLLAYEANELLGFKIGYARSEALYYSWLGGVKKALRGLGIGQALMEAQHQWARGQGYTSVETKTKNEFRSMLILNLKAGFVVTGVESQSDGSSKILMQKQL